MRLGLRLTTRLSTTPGQETAEALYVITMKANAGSSFAGYMTEGQAVTELCMMSTNALRIEAW